MTKRFVTIFFGFVLALAGVTAGARAQESPAPAAEPSSPPAAADQPSLMDREYDGRTHVTLAPYLWLPTLKQNVQFMVPRFASHGGPAILQGSVQVGPSDYLAKLNPAAMFAFDVRKGPEEVFGDYIYTNLSSNATIATIISGPRGRIKIPATFSSNSRLAASIWEIAAGFTVAHGHNADLNAFAGWRQFPINLTLSYNATIGKRGIIAPSGTVTVSPLANDVIFGLHGKAFLGDSHVFVPYYADIGVGAINQSWQAYVGAGYAFSHGQTLLLTYRSLNYNTFPADSPVQKLSMSGPLLGYTFGL